MLLALHSQLIFRMFEAIGTLQSKMHFNIFHIQSTGNMVLFVTIYHFINSSTDYSYFNEKQVLAIFYQGELCNLLDTENIEFTMIVMAYVLAVILKWINVYNIFVYDVKVESKLTEVKVEDVCKKRYF